MPIPSVEDLKRLGREAEQLLRGLELDLREALIGEKDPSGVGSKWKPRFDDFYKKLGTYKTKDTAPPGIAYLTALERDTRKNFQDMLDRAQHAHDKRPQYNDGKVTKAYDDAVSNGLSKLPGAAGNAGRDGIGRGIKSLIDAVLPNSMVRPEQAGQFAQAKQQMASDLAKWVEQQDVVEDAFFVAQSTLLDVSGYLQRQLTIHGQIRELKTWTESQPKLDATAAKKVDEQAGALGKAWNQGQNEVEKKVRKSAVSVKTDFGFNPGIVLDPSKRFLKDVNIKAGITIETSQIKIQLSGHVTITEPLLDSRQLSGGENLKLTHGPWSLDQSYAMDSKTRDLQVGVNYTRGNMSAGASYENKNGVETVKATISWRF